MGIRHVVHALRVYKSFLQLSLTGFCFRMRALFKGAYIDRGCRISAQGTFLYGRGVVIQRNAMIGVLPNANFTIEDGARIGSDAVISVGRSVAIRKNVLIAARCFIADFGHEFGDPDTAVILQGKTDANPVELGEGTWLGINVCIMPGVILGKHCVVAANSVVTTSFPDYSIVAGAPAKLIRLRKPD